MKRRVNRSWLALALFGMLLAAGPAIAQAGSGSAEFPQHSSATAAQAREPPLDIAAAVRLTKEVAYGSDPLHRFDVDAPTRAEGAPVIFTAQGGGWQRGDKAALRVMKARSLAGYPASSSSSPQITACCHERRPLNRHEISRKRWRWPGAVRRNGVEMRTRSCDGPFGRRPCGRVVVDRSLSGERTRRVPMVRYGAIGQRKPGRCEDDAKLPHAPC